VRNIGLQNCQYFFAYQRPNPPVQFLKTFVGPQGLSFPKGWTWLPGLNLVPRVELGSQGWTWFPGLNLVPRVELGSQGWTWSPSFFFHPPECEHFLMFRRMKARTEGLYPWGRTSPLWTT
jgi:hypothetical protein